MSEKSLFEKIREAGTHSVIYGLGAVLQAGLGFVLIPLYTKYYSTETYGILALLNLCGMLAGSIFWLGASTALSRSYYDYADADSRQKAIKTAFSLASAGAAIQIIGGLFLREHISQWLFRSSEYSLYVVLALHSHQFQLAQLGGALV